MIELLNIAAAIVTIGFGAIGWLAPRFTMRKLDLTTQGSTVGLSEIRAANGALFVVLGTAALFVFEPLGFVMVGFAYIGAAVGRLTSIVLDKSGALISWSFLGSEILLGSYLTAANVHLTG